MPGDNTVAAIVEPCPIVAGTVTCAQIDDAFGSEWESSSVLVRGVDGEIGLLGKAAFLDRMAGRYGYGRSLWGRQPVACVTTWSVPTVRPSTTVAQAAALIVDSAEGYRDVPVVGEDGEPLGVVRPVRVMRALAEHSAHRAATDQLTGVSSRARFIDELTTHVEALSETPGAVVVVFLDLDRLKAVNDLHGHSLGDALLRSVAQRLQAVLGSGDRLGRLGGDEFAVMTVLPWPFEAEVDQLAIAWGERLRLALATPDSALPAQAESRASIGVAVATEALADATTLLSAADEAMYLAKVAGGDRVRLAGAATAVGRQVPTDDLFLVYQPVMELTTGSVRAVEALLRLRADQSHTFPINRMQQAVRSGSTLALDRWVLANACSAMARWIASDAQAAPDRIHVNLAPESVSAPRLADDLLATIADSGLDRRRVCIELSEYSGIEDLIRATPQLASLAAAGVGLALDDMGATLGALRLLGTALPIDCVKVDRSVVEGCGKGLPFDTEMLDLVMRLSQRFGIEVVAEGVETRDEDDAIRLAGVTQVQGFLHSRPMCESDLWEFLCSRLAGVSEATSS